MPKSCGWADSFANHDFRDVSPISGHAATYTAPAMASRPPMMPMNAKTKSGMMPLQSAEYAIPPSAPVS
jgi:hypothetical protein